MCCVTVSFPNSSHRLHCPTIKGLCQHCWSRHRKQWSHLPVMVSLQHGKRISSSNRGEWYVCRVHCLSSSSLLRTRGLQTQCQSESKTSNTIFQPPISSRENLPIELGRTSILARQVPNGFSMRTHVSPSCERVTATPFYSLLLNSLLLYFLLLYSTPLSPLLLLNYIQLYYTLLYSLKVCTRLRKLPNCCLRPEVPHGIRLHVLRASDFLWTA